MARSYFALLPGVLPPQQFKAVVGAELLTISDVWAAARKSPPALLFRVRSESEPAAAVGAVDLLESCVGVVDAATRWRSVWEMARQMIIAIRQPALRQLCTQAMQFISTQHPAGVTQDQRLVIIGELMKVAEQGVEGQPPATGFEKEVAVGVARLVGADNDVEAAHYVPFSAALNPYAPEEQQPQFSARAATLEVMSGAILLTHAANRLSERAPQWIAAAMPALSEPEPDRAQKQRDRDPD